MHPRLLINIIFCFFISCSQSPTGITIGDETNGVEVEITRRSLQGNWSSTDSPYWHSFNFPGDGKIYGSLGLYISLSGHIFTNGEYLGITGTKSENFFSHFVSERIIEIYKVKKIEFPTNSYLQIWNAKSYGETLFGMQFNSLPDEQIQEVLQLLKNANISAEIESKSLPWVYQLMP